MNKIFVIVIIVIIIVAGGYFVLKSVIRPLPTGLAPSLPLTSGSSSAESIVIYNDSGFSPNPLRVKAGATVTFKNESSGQMLIASNPHPLHTDYPELTAKRTYNSGESYSFIFTRIGNWGYHNHLNPGITGTIIVE